MNNGAKELLAGFSVRSEYPDIFNNLLQDVPSKYVDKYNKLLQDYAKKQAAKEKARQEARILAQSKAKADAKAAEKKKDAFLEKFKIFKFLEQPGPIVFDSYEDEQAFYILKGTFAAGEKPAGYEAWDKEKMVSGVQFYSPAPARCCL